MYFSLTSLTHLLASVFTIIILLDIWFYYSRKLTISEKETLDKSLQLFSIALALWCINDLFNLIERNTAPDKEFEELIGGIASTLNNWAFLLSFVFFQYAPEMIRSNPGKKRYQWTVGALSVGILIIYLTLVLLDCSLAAALLDIVYSSIVLAILGILFAVTFWNRGFFGIGVVGALGCSIAVLGQIEHNPRLSSAAPDYFIAYENSLHSGTAVTGYITTLQIDHPDSLLYQINVQSFPENDSALLQATIQRRDGFSDVPVPADVFFKVTYRVKEEKKEEREKPVVYFRLHDKKDRFSLKFLSPCRLTVDTEPSSTHPNIASVLYLVSFFLIICLFVALAFSWIVVTSRSKTLAAEAALKFCVGEMGKGQLYYNMVTNKELGLEVLFLLAHAMELDDPMKDKEYRSKLQALEIKLSGLMNAKIKGEKNEEKLQFEAQGIRDGLLYLFNEYRDQAKGKK